MLGRSLLGARGGRAAQLVTATLAVAGFGALGGCLSRPIEPVNVHTTTTVNVRLPATAVDKIDLVLVVDNSSSMADKQQILSQAIPDLLTGLLNPMCVDTNGAAVMRPNGPLDKCPAGSDREFPPVLDVHIGVLSSSLGSLGTSGCPTTPSAAAPWGNPTMDDQGHLISRKDAATPTVLVPTYQGKGYLAWDPKGQLSPPGVSDLAGLEQSLRDIIVGDGQVGCGYESQNEAWYRFLVDPDPYQTITFNNSQVQTSGRDQALLDQRAAFLRPDSLLAIINVTDETDTSIRAESFYPIMSAGGIMPRARSECTTKGPDDPCCASCGQVPQPAGCPADPVCATPYKLGTDDNSSLRAFGLVSHKERYGADFFYPVSRYTDALTKQTVVGRDGKSVPNPIFSVLDPSLKGAAVRDKNMVFYAAITGVPWQLIARQKNGQPDLASGFMTSSELNAPDGKGGTFWDDIAGAPETYTSARSPFQVEALSPRTGVDPITGISVSPSAPSDNALNGHERPIGQPAGDIEYACIFPILNPIDCKDGATACDCHSIPSPDQNPLCAPNPNDIDPTTHAPRHTLQVKAKAYPGVRNLAIARGMGDNGIAASICAKTVTVDPQNPDDPEFGYRPAVNAIINRLKLALGNPCLATQLQPSATTGQVACLVLEARNTGGAPCTCDGASRKPVEFSQQSAIEQAQSIEPSTATSCFCEITPTTGAALTSCQNDKVTTGADGWCYVDETHGNPALVATCPASERREIRFVGAGQQAPNSILFISCEQD